MNVCLSIYALSVPYLQVRLNSLEIWYHFSDLKQLTGSSHPMLVCTHISLSQLLCSKVAHQKAKFLCCKSLYVLLSQPTQERWRQTKRRIDPRKKSSTHTRTHGHTHTRMQSDSILKTGKTMSSRKIKRS